MPAFASQHGGMGLFGPDPEHETRVLASLRKLRVQLGHSGSSAIFGVRNSLAHHLTSSIDSVEFENWLSKNRLHLSVHEIDTLCNFFDVDGDGHIHIDSFIKGMRGDLNERRSRIVRKAYQQADPEGTNCISIDALMAFFNAGMMPEVRRGTLSVEDANSEFVMRLKGATERSEVDSTISFDQFQEYYTWLSCCIIDDDTFVDTVSTAWKVSEIDVNQEKMQVCIGILKETANKNSKGVVDRSKCERVMRLSLRQYDLENKGSLTMEQFLKGVHLLSCTMDESVASLFFEKWGNGEGLLDYNAMSRALFV